MANCWYVIAYEHELKALGCYRAWYLMNRSFTKRFRDLVALEDRCPHAPLSAGKRKATGSAACITASNLQRMVAAWHRHGPPPSHQHQILPGRGEEHLGVREGDPDKVTKPRCRQLVAPIPILKNNPDTSTMTHRTCSSVTTC